MSAEIYRVRTMPVRQALGLSKDKSGNKLPDLQTVLHRLLAQGYVAMHFFEADGTITVISRKEFEPEVEKPSTTGPETTNTNEGNPPSNVARLGNPEIVDKTGTIG